MERMITAEELRLLWLWSKWIRESYEFYKYNTVEILGFEEEAA